ncbi:MAG: hypothetical protein FJ271_09735 [Planctomycetes bacterium]|nr:hypothetical protein [Planctomycetota bacterium]
MAATWSVGQRILAQWYPEVFFYPAVIRLQEGDKYHVLFDDGDQALVTAKQIAPLDIKAGSRVFGRYKGGPAYFPGEVDEQDGARIHIKYDDGDEEWSTISMVRVERL